MRANCANSSTSAFSDSTSPTIVDRALLDQRARRRRRRAEMPAHALGAQLNRRQRVLDLVRQPPRHVAPGGDPLRPDQRRHVVEDQHRAGRRTVARRAAASPPRRDGSRRPRARARFPAPAGCRCAMPRALDDLPQRAQIVALEHARRPAADDCPIARRAGAPPRVLIVSIGPSAPMRDDARRDPLEDRLDVPPPLVELRGSCARGPDASVRACAGSRPARRPSR